MNFSSQCAADQADNQPEPWKIDYDEAMVVRDLEDHIAEGVRFFNELREEDETFSRKVQSGQIPFDQSVARSLGERYKQWARICRHVFAYIALAEKTYNVIEGADKLRECYRIALIVDETDLDQLDQATAQVLADNPAGKDCAEDCLC